MVTTTSSISTCLVLALLAASDVLTPIQKGGQKDKEKKGGASAKTTAEVPFVPWRGNLADARTSAKERNVPILIHIILEGEEQNDEYRDKILPEPELRKRSLNALVIVSNRGQHEKKRIDVVVDGEKLQREVCAVFPMFAACQEHQAAWDEIYLEYREEDGDMKCPQTVVLTPDGKQSGRINTASVPEPGEIGALVVEAIAKAGPGLTEDQLALVKKSLEEGRRAAASQTWTLAWRAWSAVLAITQKSPYADEARGEEPKAVAGLQAELERIGSLLVPGTAAKGYEALMKFRDEATGTPIEKDIAARIKKTESDRVIQPELKAWRLSAEADVLLREATTLFDANDAKKGEKAVRKLLGARFASTGAQDTAKKLWPAIAADVEAGGK